jgi:hypothetical protein
MDTLDTIRDYVERSVDCTTGKYFPIQSLTPRQYKDLDKRAVREALDRRAREHMSRPEIKTLVMEYEKLARLRGVFARREGRSLARMYQTYRPSRSSQRKLSLTAGKNKKLQWETYKKQRSLLESSPELMEIFESGVLDWTA